METATIRNDFKKTPERGPHCVRHTGKAKKTQCRKRGLSLARIRRGGGKAPTKKVRKTRRPVQKKNNRLHKVGGNPQRSPRHHKTSARKKNFQRETISKDYLLRGGGFVQTSKPGRQVRSGVRIVHHKQERSWKGQLHVQNVELFGGLSCGSGPGKA